MSASTVSKSFMQDLASEIGSAMESLQGAISKGLNWTRSGARLSQVRKELDKEYQILGQVVHGLMSGGKTAEVVSDGMVSATVSRIDELVKEFEKLKREAEQQKAAGASATAAQEAPESKPKAETTENPPSGRTDAPASDSASGDTAGG